MRTEKQSTDIFFLIPGAWFGAMPEQSNLDRGCVTVQTDKLLDAVSFLRKYYRIRGTRASRYPEATIIDIALKVKKIKAA